MKNFVLKAILFFLIIGLSATFLSYAIDKGLRKTRYSYYAMWNDLFDSKINADLLVIGSSRARQHFSTQILDSCLKLNTYVMGMEAYRFKMYYDVFHLYLKHNKKPKYLIISLDIYSIYEDQNSYYYQQFLPYLDFEFISGIYNDYRHKFTLADYYFTAYKYRGERTQMTIGLLEYIGIRRYQDETWKGYEPFEHYWITSVNKKQVNRSQKVDQKDVLLFHSLIAECKSLRIKPILVFSPEYVDFQKMIINRDSIISLYQHIAGVNNIPFLNFSKDSICREKIIFYNTQHLNRQGSIIFTKKLANNLKQIIY